MLHTQGHFGSADRSTLLVFPISRSPPLRRLCPDTWLCVCAVERLGQKLKSGELKDIVAIPTSIRTKEQAESLGIPLVTLDTHSGQTTHMRNTPPFGGLTSCRVGDPPHAQYTALLERHEVSLVLWVCSAGCGDRRCG